jgi:hypothetical protein
MGGMRSGQAFSEADRDGFVDSTGCGSEMGIMGRLKIWNIRKRSCQSVHSPILYNFGLRSKIIKLAALTSTSGIPRSVPYLSLLI